MVRVRERAVAKTAKRRDTPRQRAINKRAIRQLQSVSEEFSGTALAKEARALERALSSANPNKATTQRRLQSFAQAAARQASPKATPKTMKRAVTSSKKSAIGKRAASSARTRYQSAVFKCWGDYETCCKHADWKLCAALLAICVTNQLKALGFGTGAGAAYFTIKHLLGH
jgi:hypothetical protein